MARSIQRLLVWCCRSIGNHLRQHVGKHLGGGQGNAKPGAYARLRTALIAFAAYRGEGNRKHPIPDSRFANRLNQNGANVIGVDQQCINIADLNRALLVGHPANSLYSGDLLAKYQQPITGGAS